MSNQLYPVMSMANTDWVQYTGCLQIQLNKFPVDFQDTSRRHLKKLSVGFYVVTAWLIILRRQAMYAYSRDLPTFVILADNYWAGLLTPEIAVILFTLQLNLEGVRNCRLVIKNFQEDQLNFRRFPVSTGGISNSSRLPVFPGAVDTLVQQQQQQQ